jgi:hypothetical protein
MSPRIHLVQEEPKDMREIVALFDRFLNGPMNYPLEWDDFISWKKSNRNIEDIRLRLEEAERLLFSKDRVEKAMYGAIVQKERDRAAALCGIPARYENADQNASQRG